MMMNVQRIIAACNSCPIGLGREWTTRPQELEVTRFDKEVFRYEGIPQPVMCEKIKNYQDRYFTSRLLPKVDVPTLKV